MEMIIEENIETTMNNLETIIHQETQETTTTEEPAPVEELPLESNIEISSKLKNRSDYMNTIRDVSEKLGHEPPKNLARKSKKELKKMLAKLTTEGVHVASGIETPPNNRDDYACVVLYNLNKFALNFAANMSHNYKDKTGFVINDPVKNLEQNEEQKTALKIAIRGVWNEYKDDLEPFMSPIANLVIINFTILTSAMERYEKKSKQQEGPIDVNDKIILEI